MPEIILSDGQALMTQNVFTELLISNRSRPPGPIESHKTGWKFLNCTNTVWKLGWYSQGQLGYILHEAPILIIPHSWWYEIATQESKKTLAKAIT